MKKSVLDYNLKIRLPITLFVLLTTFALTYYIARPERDGIGYSPDQPINFPHKLHAGEMGIDCQYCHIGADKTRHALVPSTDVCMNCHTIARKDRPEIQKLTKYYKEGIPIRWQRVHKVPEFAYFNHSVHINSGLQCSTCHGSVENMEKIEQVKSFAMSACLDCHRNAKQYFPQVAGLKRGPDNCWACHR